MVEHPYLVCSSPAVVQPLPPPPGLTEGTRTESYSPDSMAQNH